MLTLCLHQWRKYVEANLISKNSSQQWSPFLLVNQSRNQEKECWRHGYIKNRDIQASLKFTLWFTTSVGRSIFKKHLSGYLWFLISDSTALIMGKQASAASLKSWTLLLPATLKDNQIDIEEHINSPPVTFFLNEKQSIYFHFFYRWQAFYYHKIFKYKEKSFPQRQWHQRFFYWCNKVRKDKNIRQ